MILDGYFIAPDGAGDPWLWRKTDNDAPVPVLSQYQLRKDPAVWEFLLAATRETP